MKSFAIDMSFVSSTSNIINNLFYWKSHALAIVLFLQNLVEIIDIYYLRNIFVFLNCQRYKSIKFFKYDLRSWQIVMLFGAGIYLIYSAIVCNLFISSMNHLSLANVSGNYYNDEKKSYLTEWHEKNHKKIFVGKN